MSSQESRRSSKKTYDDITFQKQRKMLIQLIDQQKWTIRTAAQRIGIKLCTAKHILYLYRKQGKIYRKKGQTSWPATEALQAPKSILQPNVIYVPYPLFVFCLCPAELVPINLEC